MITIPSSFLLKRPVFLFLLFSSCIMNEANAQCGSLTVTITPVNPTICGTSTVTITAAASGGTAPYSYVWNDGQTTPSITVSSAGTYTVTVNDNTNCSSVNKTITVKQSPPALTPPVTWSNSPVCTGETLFLEAANFINAAYNWTGPNGFTDTSRTPLINNVALINAGLYSVTVTVDGCTTAPGTTSVVVNQTPATPTAGNNGPLCAGTTLNLTDSTIAGKTYIWTGPGNFSSTAQDTMLTNITLSNAGLYTVAAILNGCKGKADSTAVLINPLPSIPSISNNGPLCAGQTLALISGTVPAAVYAWTGPNGYTSSVQSPLINNISLTDAGTYSVTASANGCTSAAVSTNVIVQPLTVSPTVNSNSPLCNADTLRLTTPFIAGVTYSWSGPNGFISTQQNPVINNVSTSNAGIYTLTISGCNSSVNTTTVTVKPTPATPLPGSNSPLCIGATLNLTATSDPGATYSWSGPNSFTSSIQNASINNVSAVNAGVYNVMATLNGCTSSSATTTVNINAPSTSNAGSAQTVCADNSSVIIAGTITGGSTTGIWSSGGSGTFSPGNTSLNATYNFSNADKAAGGVTLTLTSTANGACPAASSSILVTITPAVTVDAGIDRQICIDEKSISLSGQITTASGGSWSTNGTGTFSPDNTSLVTTYFFSTADKINGTVTFNLVSTGNGNCIPVSDAMTVTINGPLVNAGEDVSVLQNQLVTLNPAVSGTNLQFLWTPNLYLNNNTIKNPVVKGVDDQLYTLKVTDATGCSNEDDVFVKVLKFPVIPNTFTPNNDGINDLWIIKNLQDYPDCRIQVFNRYGQLLFESKGYVKPWDGTDKGKSVPIGTYYYIIEPGSGLKAFTGYVTIIK